MEGILDWGFFYWGGGGLLLFLQYLTSFITLNYTRYKRHIKSVNHTNELKGQYYMTAKGQGHSLSLPQLKVATYGTLRFTNTTFVFI